MGQKELAGKIRDLKGLKQMAEDDDLYAELEFATEAYIARVTQEHYRLGFQDALRLMAGA